MIAQLILTAFLLGILLYALTEYRRSPAVGLIAVLATVGGLYFVWVPSHATHLADFVEPRCRPHYLYLDRDQSAPST